LSRTGREKEENHHYAKKGREKDAFLPWNRQKGGKIIEGGKKKKAKGHSRATIFDDIKEGGGEKERREIAYTDFILVLVRKGKGLEKKGIHEGGTISGRSGERGKRGGRRRSSGLAERSQKTKEGKRARWSRSTRRPEHRCQKREEKREEIGPT